MKTKKITLATLKSFIRKNHSQLQIKVKSKFDGMYDCVMPTEKSEFQPVRAAGAGMQERTLGIAGVWVCNSGNYITEYDNGAGFKGFNVWNCCGEFTLIAPVQ